MSFYDGLERYGSQIALVSEAGEMDYAALASCADAVVKHVAPRSLVFIICSNGMETPVGYLGMLRKRAVPVMVNQSPVSYTHLDVYKRQPLKLCTPDYVQKILSVNTFAFIELLRVAAKKKNSREGASFVGISSVAAFRGGKGQGIYSTAKGAMDAMIRPFAKELAPRQIRLNNVAFGMIHTEMYETYLNSGGSAQDLERDQYLGVGRPEDAAKAICYLLSDAAKFITGTTMVCDGGFLS